MIEGGNQEWKGTKTQNNTPPPHRYECDFYSMAMLSGQLEVDLKKFKK